MLVSRNKECTEYTKTRNADIELSPFLPATGEETFCTTAESQFTRLQEFAAEPKFRDFCKRSGSHNSLLRTGLRQSIVFWISAAKLEGNIRRYTVASRSRPYAGE